MQQTIVEDEDVMADELDGDSGISVPDETFARSSEEAESTVSDEEEIQGQDGIEEESGELPDPEYGTIQESVVEESPETPPDEVSGVAAEEVSGIMAEEIPEIEEVSEPDEASLELTDEASLELTDEASLELSGETPFELSGEEPVELPGEALSGSPEDTSVKLPEENPDKGYISRDVFEEEILGLRSAIEDMQRCIDARLTSDDECVPEINGNIVNTVNIQDFNSLKRDFNVLSKRLKGVLKEADATRAEVLDATKIPPEVLEITYAKTLNDLYSEMLNEFGENEASEIVSSVMDNIRESVAGMNFIKFDDGRFTLLKLSESIEKKLVSSKQIHAMYLEFVRKLSCYIPNYDSRDFRSFVETGSREYTVDKIAIHEKRLDRFKEEFGSVKDELARISGHFESIAKVKGECAEEVKSNVDDLSDITGKFNILANAVNSHTRFIKKLNENILETRSIVESYKSETTDGFSDISSYIDSVIETRACQTGLQDLALELNSFREQIHESSETLKYRVEEGLNTKADSGPVENTISDLSVLRDEFAKLQEEVVFLKSAAKLPALERIVYSTLYGLGTATLKKLEIQMKSDGTEIHEDELFSTIDKLEKRGCVSSQKKGRYTYYSLSM